MIIVILKTFSFYNPAASFSFNKKHLEIWTLTANCSWLPAAHYERTSSCYRTVSSKRLLHEWWLASKIRVLFLFWTMKSIRVSCSCYLIGGLRTVIGRPLQEGLRWYWLLSNISKQSWELMSLLFLKFSVLQSITRMYNFVCPHILMTFSSYSSLLFNVLTTWK